MFKLINILCDNSFHDINNFTLLSIYHDRGIKNIRQSSIHHNHDIKNIRMRSVRHELIVSCDHDIKKSDQAMIMTT